jgi:ABC-type branched-subunit amino acid transport system ATPase component
MSELLRAEALSKAFGGVRALDEATVTVREGSIAGLIGPNGSGKTTLFNIVTGYERCDAGTVRFGGEAITDLPPERVFAAGIGRTFQITRIFPRLSVLENMLVPARGRSLRRVGPAARRRAAGLLERVGLDAMAAWEAGTLSFGQRKLLELACVLSCEPALILLDEPAGGVNPTLINSLAGHIRDLNAGGVTFLIVEHNMEFVMGLCDEVTVLDAGQVITSGPPDIIRTDKRVLDAYLGAGYE